MVTSYLGNVIIRILHRIGAQIQFFWGAIRVVPHRRALLEELRILGLGSLPVVIMASMFTGFIATWQVHYLAGDMIGLELLGMMVIKAVFSELGPMLIGLVLGGRIGAKVAAEIATMRVTEQIDAMTSLSLNPYRYIVTPRIIAGSIMTPLLFIYGALVAIVSAQLLATLVFDLAPGVFYNSLRLRYHSAELVMGLSKSVAFGIITSVVSSYYGYMASGGAVGVGKATRSAVVATTMAILLANLILSKVLM